MSKQSEAKKEQGYVDKAIPAVCSNCTRYTSDIIAITGRYFPHTTYKKEKNKRCAIGGFAVKKHGYCKMHEFKEKT